MHSDDPEGKHTGKKNLSQTQIPIYNQYPQSVFYTKHLNILEVAYIKIMK